MATTQGNNVLSFYDALKFFNHDYVKIFKYWYPHNEMCEHRPHFNPYRCTSDFVSVCSINTEKENPQVDPGTKFYRIEIYSDDEDDWDFVLESIEDFYNHENSPFEYGYYLPDEFRCQYLRPQLREVSVLPTCYPQCPVGACLLTSRLYQNLFNGPLTMKDVISSDSYCPPTFSGLLDSTTKLYLSGCAEESGFFNNVWMDDTVSMYHNCIIDCDIPVIPSPKFDCSCYPSSNFAPPPDVLSFNFVPYLSGDVWDQILQLRWLTSVVAKKYLRSGGVESWKIVCSSFSHKQMSSHLILFFIL